MVLVMSESENIFLKSTAKSERILNSSNPNSYNYYLTVKIFGKGKGKLKERERENKKIIYMVPFMSKNI